MIKHLGNIPDDNRHFPYDTNSHLIVMEDINCLMIMI
jgi:hypothetical protein